MVKGFFKDHFSVHCQEIYDKFEIVDHVFAHSFCTGSWKMFGMSQKNVRDELFFPPLRFLSISRKNVSIGTLLA